MNRIFCYFPDLDHFQLGTLSHMIGAKANEYQELPDWPETAPDPSVRNVEVVVPWTDKKTSTKKPDKKSFYSDEESSSPVGEELCDLISTREKRCLCCFNFYSHINRADLSLR